MLSYADHISAITIVASLECTRPRLEPSLFRALRVLHVIDDRTTSDYVSTERIDFDDRPPWLQFDGTDALKEVLKVADDVNDDRTDTRLSQMCTQTKHRFRVYIESEVELFKRKE